ncbi:MAG TPA: lysophospholipid acyltransferase family protein [Micromonosporaceae bacterium]|jgi:1-acyl-sn-glycerol-3-phosphate acyltransferase
MTQVVHGTRPANSYAPTSPCGRGCLPRHATLPRVALPVRVWRVLALVTVLGAGIGVAVVVPFLRPGGRDRAVRAWFRAVVAATGVRLTVTGATSAESRGRWAFSGGGPALVASNHLSWLDIPALLAVQPMRVLAKSEVRGWPVIGFLATRAGTLFIDRRRLRRLPQTVAEIATGLRGGDTVLVFPEGSTWCGRTEGRFRPATMQSAIDASAPVRPISLRYRLADGTPTTVAAWVGTDTLLASVWRIAGTRGLTAHVDVGPLVETIGRTRREVAAAAMRANRRPSPAPLLSSAAHRPYGR